MALPSMFSLEGQTALVTGGTRGIGQAMAVALAEAGANILLVQVCFLGILCGEQTSELGVERCHQHGNKDCNREARS